MTNYRSKIMMLACGGIFSAQLQAKDNVNFIIIHLDDMGYGDLTVTGATGYSTPNIDRLCTEGARFTNYYSAQAVSSASRAGLLTGCYPNRIGFSGALGPSGKTGIHPDEETIAEVLKKQNYTCSAIGKWHLGHLREFLPLQHGFDEYFGLPYSNDMWPYHPTANFPELPLIENNDIINPNVMPEDQEQLTTWYTERAVKFIKNNKNAPFFLYLAHSMPHVPLYVSDKFKGKSEQGTYGDVMMEIDWSVGEILKTLKENKLDKNTLIIFTSDNGPWINYGNHAGSTGGLREGKGCTFEGGQRVPCIMRWPGKVPAGVVINQLASSIDLLPTLAEICGAPLPSKKIDGVSLRKLILEDMADKPREYFLFYYRKNNLEAVRNAGFKLILPHSGRTYENFLPGNDGKPGKTNENSPVGAALYDMRRDPGERYNVYEQYPGTVAELMKIAEAAREDLGDDLTNHPGKNRRPMGMTRD
jgi:arylsulfatase